MRIRHVIKKVVLTHTMEAVPMNSTAADIMASNTDIIAVTYEFADGTIHRYEREEG